MPAAYATSAMAMPTGSSMPPPPGLDPLTPAKVMLKATPPEPHTSNAYIAPAHPLPSNAQAPQIPGLPSAFSSPDALAAAAVMMQPPMPTRDDVLSALMPQGGQTSGEWFNAVLSTAAHLNKQGLEQALDILDHAIKNVQYAKAIEMILASANSRQTGAAPPALPHVVAAELWRTQVCREQQQLLQRLLALRSTLPKEQGATAPAQAMAPKPKSEQWAGGKSEQWAQAAVAQVAARRMPPASAGIEMEAGMRQAPGEVQTAGRAYGRQVQTLSTSLQMLSNEDPECLFIVRRINKLGFKASRKLKQHFAGYGSVVRVLVAHSTVRQHGDPQCYARRRPSSLGFVHMSTAQAVRHVLSLGEEQEVDGSMIRVQRFERQRTEQAIEEEEEDVEVENNCFDKMDHECWGRQHTASTTATANSLESNDSLA